MQVFSDAEETQVPQLRNYVHKVTQERKRQAMDTLISSLSRLVSDVQNVMTNSSMKVWWYKYFFKVANFRLYYHYL